MQFMEVRLCSLAIIVFLSPSRGDYILRVQVHSYDNPTDFCAVCGEDQGCCDDFDREECTAGNLDCENVFFYCVRPSGTPTQTLETILEDTEFDNLNSIEDRERELQCTPSLAAFRSTPTNDFIDFSQPTFLGIPNPMEFQVVANKWEGSQIYLDVSDRDPPDNRDDFIDSFAIDLEPSDVPAGHGMTEVMSFLGNFGFATTELSFEVECLPGFVGETCVPICNTEPCSNNGTCLQSPSGFTCTCRGDFTGETCEARIIDCQDVDCNNGTCVDGVQSFTCQCEEGFTGESCVEVVPTTIFTTTTGDSTNIDNSNNSNGNVGAVAGAVVGSVIAIFVIAIVIVSFIILFLWRQRRKVFTREPDSESIPTKVNAVYGITTRSADSEDISTTANVVYGIKD